MAQIKENVNVYFNFFFDFQTLALKIPPFKSYFELILLFIPKIYIINICFCFLPLSILQSKHSLKALLFP